MEDLEARAVTTHGSKAPVIHGMFATNGEFWTISFNGPAFSLQSVFGLTYIQRLLQNPGVEIRAADLTMGVGATVGNEGRAEQLRNEGDEFAPRSSALAQPILDDEALRSYKRHIANLNEQLEDALELHQTERAEEIRAEIAAIAETLRGLLDRRGRPRVFGSDEERARLNVFRAIKVALQKIERNHSELGGFLERTIRTGQFCIYNPGAEQVEWRFSLDEQTALTTFVPPRKASGRGLETVEPLNDTNAFVGREAERAALANRLERALAGEGGIVLIGGSAGIGKTRLARETAAIAIERGFVARVGSCYDREDSVPFVPVVEIMEAALAARGDEPQAFRRLLGDEAGEIARVVPQLYRRFPDIPPPAQVSPEQSRRALFNAIVTVIARRAAQDPMLLTIEDLHWADEGTLALLVAFARAVAELRMVILVTYRDDEVMEKAELAKALEELGRLRVTRLHLDGLTREAVAELIGKLSGRTPPASFVEMVFSYTEGNPFYVEELYRHLEGQTSPGDEEIFQRAELDLPTSLKLALGRRLARVSKDTLRALAAAAVIGRSFTFALLEASTKFDPDLLIDCVEEGERAGLITSWFQYPETHFRFAHELIRRAVLDDLSMARQQRLHLNVAQAIEGLFPTAADDHADDLAHHLWNAGGAADAAKTVTYLQKAGERAVASSANREAAGHFKRALKLVETFPETSEQTQLNLMLHVALGTPLTATQGFASEEVEAVWARARELCQRVGDAPQLFPVLWGLSVMHTARGKHRAARELAEQCVRMAEKTGDSGMILAAHHALGISLSILGEYESALDHLGTTIALYQPELHGALAFQFGQDFGVVARSHAALDLWHLGFAEQALRRNTEALELAANIAHPYSQAAALDFSAWLHQMGRNRSAVEEAATAARKLSIERGFAYWSSIGDVFHGAASAGRGQILDGIQQIREGLSTYRSIGGGVMVPAFLSLLADAQGRAGQLEGALKSIREAQDLARTSEEHWWEPELHRIEGDLWLRQASAQASEQSVREAARRCFEHALNLASAQKAKLLELRAASSLEKLIGKQRPGDGCYQRLTSVFGWFTEGLQSPDLMEARTLIEERRGRS